MDVLTIKEAANPVLTTYFSLKNNTLVFAVTVL